MTRTVFVGKPNAKEQMRYETLHRVQEHTCAAVKPGTSVKTIDAECRRLLGTELNRQFIHSLGHGLGTQVHEWPRVGPADIALEPGMVITIEPGIYKRGMYGMRIEDDILVTKTGHRALNTSTKTLIVID